MMYVFNETYQSAYEIPSPFRKWFINRYNKQKEKEHKKNNPDVPDVNQPLNPAQKQKYKNKNK